MATAKPVMHQSQSYFSVSDHSHAFFFIASQSAHDLRHVFLSEDVFVQVSWENSQVTPVRHFVHLACVMKVILNYALMLLPP